MMQIAKVHIRMKISTIHSELMLLWLGVTNQQLSYLRPLFNFLENGHSVRLFCPSYFCINYDDFKNAAAVKALQSIKKSLSDPFGHLHQWNKGDPCASNWTGIICYDTILEDGYLHVQELLLLDKNLTGTLSLELDRLSYLKIMDFMWNKISGSIPKELGNISTLRLLLLSGNQLTGSLPDELSYLSSLDRLQIDGNDISGPIPKSFANLSSVKHIHMNNNSLTGQIPPELSRLPILVHLLLDNNNLSGYLPPEISKMPNLQILDMSLLLKLSLRNCSLKRTIPDWSNVSFLAYIDLSWNHLSGSIPAGALSKNITTIDLYNNNLNGTIPSSFAKLPLLQKLSLANNSLIGSIPSVIWQSRTLNATEQIILLRQQQIFEYFGQSCHRSQYFHWVSRKSFMFKCKPNSIMRTSY